MPNVPSSLQEPDPADRQVRSIWFGMRCEFTRAVLDGAMSSSDVIAPVALVLPASPRTTTSGWPEPPFDRWIRSLGIEIIELKESSRAGWQPLLDRVQALRPTVGIGACFPYKAPRRVRHAFPLGVINIHPSLLPRLRGPEPVFHAYRLGLDTTGVSLHLMDEGWDTGPVLNQQSIPIPDQSDARELEASLARHGGAMLAETVTARQAGAILPQPQDESDASWAPAPVGDELVIPAHLTVRQVIRMVNAVGDAYGQLVVRDTQAGTLMPVARLAADQTGEVREIEDHLGVVKLRCADGVVRFDRYPVDNGRA